MTHNLGTTTGWVWEVCVSFVCSDFENTLASETDESGSLLSSYGLAQNDSSLSRCTVY